MLSAYVRSPVRAVCDGALSEYEAEPASFPLWRSLVLLQACCLRLNG